MRRTFIVGVVVIGLVLLAAIALVARLTRSAGGGAPDPHQPAAVPSSPLADATPPVPLAAPPAVMTPPTKPVGALPPEPGRPWREKARGPARFDFSFKLDPRLTRGVHMGDLWVSPPTYTRTGAGAGVIVEARARVIGGSDDLIPAWTASQPDMVEVQPPEGAQVNITVLRAGESRLTVESAGVSRTLTVKAAQLAGGLRVDIVQ